MKNTVALLTDFGLNDNYVGVVKGVILTINPRVKLIDITHRIKSHKINEAAFVLRTSFSYFPKGMVFLVVVDPGVGSSRAAIAIKTKNYYFLGPDNGVLWPAAEADGIKKMIELNDKRFFLKNISSTFQGRDIFAPVAAHLCGGVSFSQLGKAIERIKKLDFVLPKEKRRFLEGEVIYIDKFGNLVTNIEKSFLQKFLKGKKFRATLAGKKIKTLSGSYVKNRPNEPFFIEGSFGYLEVSLKGESAKNYFKISPDKKTKLIIKKI